MATYVGSSLNPLFSKTDVYDNWLGKAVARAVLAQTDLTAAIVEASRNNPSRAQRVFYDDIVKQAPQYLPIAEETFTETRNPYGQVHAAFDYIVRTQTVLGGASNAVTSSINPALKDARERLGDYSFSQLDPHTVYRTKNAPYKYNISNRDAAGRVNIFEVSYVLPFVKIKQTLTRGEYVNQYMFKNHHNLHNEKEWGGPDSAYPLDSNGDIYISFPLLIGAPTIVIPDYDPDHVYTFMEYMVGVGTVGNLARGVFAYNHTVNNNRDSVIDNLLVDTLKTSNGDPLTGKFYPVIPIRLNNISTKNSIDNKVKDLLKIRYKIDLEEIYQNQADATDSANVDDIYMVHGVPLNSKKQSHKQYLFQFFRDYTDFSNNLKLQVQAGSMKVELRATTMGLSTDPYDAALGKSVSIGSASGVVTMSRNRADKSAKETVSFVGFEHVTTILENTIVINAVTALGDESFDEFMVPLHDPTYNKLQNSDKISISGSNLYLIRNSITHRTKGFWEAFLEVFLVAVAVAAILIPFIGQAAATGLGAIVVGGIGLTGSAALIVGGLINVAATGASLELIQGALGGIVGNKDAAILTAVIGIAVSGFISGQGGFAKQWQNLNAITKGSTVTNALADIYNIVRKEELQKIGAQFNDLTDLYNQEQEANEQRNKRFEKSDILYDFSTRQNNKFVVDTEKPGEFLKRTTLVGSDLVDISLGSVEHFTRATLRLPLIG